MNATARRFPRLATTLVVLLVISIPVVPAQEGVGGGSATIAGKITMGAAKSAPQSATVLAYHLSTAEVYRATVSSSNGRFELTGIPHGYYDIAIETPDGMFVGNQVVNAPPGGKVAVNLNLIPTEAAGEGPRDFPGADKAAAGIARAVDKKLGKKGVALITVAAVGVGAALIGGGSSSSSSSPSNPN